MSRAVTQTAGSEVMTPQPSTQSTTGLLPETFGQVIEMAQLMAKSGPAVPAAFRGNPGVCAAVCFQALHWQMSPYALAQHAYVINDKVAYEARAIMAAINGSGVLRERFAFTYEGEGDQVRCTIEGIDRLTGKAHSLTTPPLRQIHPKNSPLWKSDPEQQLAYYAARAWGRRFAPDVMMGVMDREEVETIEASDVARPEGTAGSSRQVAQKSLMDALATEEEQ